MAILRNWPGVALAAGLFGLLGCTTAAKPGDAVREQVPPPTIYANMPLDKALEAAIDFGGDTLAEVKRLVKRRGEGEKAGRVLETALHEGLGKYEHNQIMNVGHLYASMPVPVAPATFKELIGSERPLARQIGWQLAAVKPSPDLARAIDAELSRALKDNDEETVLMPQMANAVRANHLRGAYTLMRQGLMAKGDEEFALAMMTLEPDKASDDFLNYLAQAPADELRQLTLSSVNLYTCVSILHHLQATPPNIGAPNFEHLFFYAVSRNSALAELAQTIIESYLPHRTDLMAQLLAKQPVWVQIAYIYENTHHEDGGRQRMSPKVGLLLSELKKTTSVTDVVDEINEARL